MLSGYFSQISERKFDRIILCSKLHKIIIANLQLKFKEKPETCHFHWGFRDSE